jgi:HEAT repeat protein
MDSHDQLIIPTLIDRLSDENPAVRKIVVSTLATFPRRELVQPLAMMLTDTDYEVRAEAARSLRVLGDKAAVEHLIAAVRTLNYYAAPMAEALGALGNPAAVPTLIELLKHTASRCDAVLALGQLRDRRAVVPLIGVLVRDECESVATLGALVKLADPRAIEPIRRRLSDPTCKDVARNALIALGASWYERRTDWERSVLLAMALMITTAILVGFRTDLAIAGLRLLCAIFPNHGMSAWELALRSDLTNVRRTAIGSLITAERYQHRDVLVSLLQRAAASTSEDVTHLAQRALDLRRAGYDFELTVTQVCEKHSSYNCGYGPFETTKRYEVVGIERGAML